MATLHVDAPEPKLTLELTLDEAAVLMLLTGKTAGISVEPSRIFAALSDCALVDAQTVKFKFTPGDGRLSMRVDPR